MKDKTRRETWALCVAYYGPAYASFTWQPEHPHETVIGRVQHAVKPLLAGRSAAVVSSAGRTDKGVSALGQLLSFQSWEPLTHEVRGRG